MSGGRARDQGRCRRCSCRRYRAAAARAAGAASRAARAAARLALAAALEAVALAGQPGRVAVLQLLGALLGVPGWPDRALLVEVVRVLHVVANRRGASAAGRGAARGRTRATGGRGSTSAQARARGTRPRISSRLSSTCGWRTASSGPAVAQRRAAAWQRVVDAAATAGRRDGQDEARRGGRANPVELSREQHAQCNSSSRGAMRDRFHKWRDLERWAFSDDSKV